MGPEDWLILYVACRAGQGDEAQLSCQRLSANATEVSALSLTNTRRQSDSDGSESKATRSRGIGKLKMAVLASLALHESVCCLFSHAPTEGRLARPHIWRARRPTPDPPLYLGVAAKHQVWWCCSEYLMQSSSPGTTDDSGALVRAWQAQVARHGEPRLHMAIRGADRPILRPEPLRAWQSILQHHIDMLKIAWLLRVKFMVFLPFS